VHAPSAVELIDRLILEAGRSRAGYAMRNTAIAGDPEALLVIEFEGDHDDVVREKLNDFAADAEISRTTTHFATVQDRSEQSDVWTLRKSGLGLLMSKPGDEQPYSFVEDTAVEPARLAEYITRFKNILDDEGVHAGYYAHASVGCIHVKPVLNLKASHDIEKMRRIAEKVCDLAVEFGGTMSGEHGDGIVRSCWLERLYGPRIIDAFRELKRIFDPDGLMNPGKIVNPKKVLSEIRPGTVTVTIHLDGHAPESVQEKQQRKKEVVELQQGEFLQHLGFAAAEERHSAHRRLRALARDYWGKDQADQGLRDLAQQMK